MIELVHSVLARRASLQEGIARGYDAALGRQQLRPGPEIRAELPAGMLEALTIAGVIGILFAAGYILWTIQRVFWGEPDARWAELRDATAWWERGPLLAMTAVILAVGVYPAWLMDLFESGVRPIADRLG